MSPHPAPGSIRLSAAHPIQYLVGGLVLVLLLAAVLTLVRRVEV